MRHWLSACALLGTAFSAGASQTADRVVSVQLRRTEIVIRGADLSKVEIWAMPTGTGMEDQHVVFGSAVRKGAAGQKEIWVFRLPRCTEAKGDGYLAAEIVAVGFDAAGTEVGRHDLEPGLGAIELYKTLCIK